MAGRESGRTDMEDNRIDITIDAAAAGKRMDAALAQLMPDMSRSFIQKLIEKGDVLVNGCQCSKKDKAAEGAKVSVMLPEPELLDVEPENIPLDIVYEDEHVLVVNKPAGMVVHPAPGNYSGTLVNALMYHCGENLSAINGVIRPGIVHRIDKDTSGLLMVAKSDTAHAGLSRQLKDHSLTRNYQAIVYNNIKEDEGTVDAPIGRDPSNRMRNAVIYQNSRNAVTHYRVLERFGELTLIEAVLETGRTHQIRVHMSYIKHPLLGDSLYGPQKKNKLGASRQMLHAGTLGFVHPVSGEYLEFTCQPPEDFMKVLGRLRERK